VNDDDDKDVDSTSQRDPVIGSEVSGYRVTNRLGSGGMGIVYEGEQPTIGKRVAIKVLRHEVADDPEVVQRLVSEARAVNKVGHRGIIDVFGFGSLPDGRQCIVMEYLDGEPLEAVLTTYRKQHSVLPITDSLVILEEVLSALAAAHAAGVIHRDLKPSNIFLCRQRDGTQFVKLLDFGIAKLGVLGHTPATRASIMVGTPSYMAPEQATGGMVGPAMDLYAIGVLAFELLTGRQPFAADSVMEMLLKHQEEIPPRAASLNMGVPDELDALIAKLLAKRPADRPQSAELVREQITHIRKQLAGTAGKKLSLPVDSQRSTLVDPPVPVQVAVHGADGTVDANSHTRATEPEAGRLQSTEVVTKPATTNSLEQRAATTPDLMRITGSPAIQRSKTPFVVLALIAIGLVGGTVALFGGGGDRKQLTPAPPDAVRPLEPVAQPVAVKPVEPIAVKPVEPVVVKPPADEPGKPVATKPPVPPKSPPGKDATRLNQQVRVIEKNLDRAEREGDNVALYRKALSSLKGKLTQPLTPQDLESLEAALARLEEETAP